MVARLKVSLSEVRVDGACVATLGRGCTFGWNFLMKQPQ